MKRRTLPMMGGGVGGVQYILYDQFLTDRAAGAVHGTAPEPTGTGTREITDTNGKISIISGELDFATGAAIHDGARYASQARTNGRVLIWKVKPSDTNGIINVGWDTDGSGAINDRLIFAAGGVLQIAPNGGTAFTVGAYTAGTYYVAAVMRSTGLYWLIKGEAYTDWSLIGITAAGTADGLAAITAGSTTSIFKADDARIPDVLWLIDMLCYDTFTRGDGAIGNSETTGADGQTIGALAWTGGAISTNKNVITPSLGSELWDADAAAFTSGTYAWEKSWATPNNNTVANVGNALQITYVDNSWGAIEYLNNAKDLSSDLTVGQWYGLSRDVFINTGAVHLYMYDGVSSNSPQGDAVTSITPISVFSSFRAKHATNTAIQFGNLGAGEVVTLDNLSLKPLTLSSLFSTVQASSANAYVSGNGTGVAGTQWGIVVNLDSASSPANFVIAYLDGTNLKVDKCVGGTYTALYSAAQSPIAGVLPVIMKLGTSYYLYYNGVYKTVLTISDAGIVSNVRHGFFSTYNGNYFTKFECYPITGHALDEY